MKKVLLLGTCLVAVTAVAGQLYFASEAREPESPRPRRSYVGDEVVANGVVEGARPETKLRPQLSSALAAIHVHEGQQVAAGALLAELCNESQQSRVRLAQAELAKAKAALEKLRNGERREKRQAAAADERAKQNSYLNADANLRRSERLRSAQAVSQQGWDVDFFVVQRTKAEWEQAKAERALVEAPARAEDIAAAEATVAAAQAQYQWAQAELAKTRLLAPRQGQIMQIYAEPGEIAGPDSPQPLLILADLSKRRVRAFVEELDAAHIQVGQKAVTTVDGLPGKEFHGTLAVVFPRMGKRSPRSDAAGEYKDVYFREALIDLESGDELPLNLRVQTRILGSKDANE